MNDPPADPAPAPVGAPPVAPRLWRWAVPAVLLGVLGGAGYGAWDG